MRRGGVWSHRTGRATIVVLVIACCVAIGVAVGGAARLSSRKAKASSPAQERSTTSIEELRAALAGSLTFSPKPGATSVGPDAPIVVKAGAGHLTEVRVASPTGGNVTGAFTSSTHQMWQSNGWLEYGTAYRVTAAVSGAAHASVSSSMTFRTLIPAGGVAASSVFPSNGLTVGVGQPVVFELSQPVTDAAARASVLAHLSVTETRPVSGGWYWFSDTELHFRPQTYWPAGEHVTVTWNLSGWNAGANAWGSGQGVTHFVVGDAHVAFANLATDQMTVTDNGRTIATYPISGGKPTDPTMDGAHIVLDRSSVVRMDSATNGVPVNSADGYDELVYDDVHISDSGEYVHAAPWSVGSQGHTNVSHGCINLSPDNALAFFAFSRVGDVVLVVGSPRAPALGDHGVMDWDTNWLAFTPANVLLRTPTGIGSMR